MRLSVSGKAASRDSIGIAPFLASLDVCALSCLLTTSEWGPTFSRSAQEPIELNCALVDSCRGGSWIDRISWELCGELLPSWDFFPHAFERLAANLDHPNSSVRIWMMEIAWMVQPKLYREEVMSHLLGNLAEILFGPFMAAGLGARFFPDFDQFIAQARSFQPRAPYEEQYRARLDDCAKEGAANSPVTILAAGMPVSQDDREGLAGTSVIAREEFPTGIVDRAALTSKTIYVLGHTISLL